MISDAATKPGETSVRIVAANLTSGDKQSYDPGHGARILEALHADLILLQELNVGDGSDAALRTFVDTTFGRDFGIHRETSATVPNGIVSRFPIVERGEWTDPGASGTRDFVWARIDVPGARDLWAVSVHLKASTDAFETRTKEADALVAEIKRVVPEKDLLVVGGDFNTDTAEEPCLAVLGAIVGTAPPFPVDAKNNAGTNAGRTAPYDWVLADPDLTKLQVPTKVGGSTYAAGLVFDTRTFPRLEAVPPARIDDSAAPSMQHMAIVKDFVLR